MSTNLEYRARERQRNRESGRQASEAQREKGRQGFRARDEKPKETSFCWKNNMEILCTGGDKMRNASCHQCKVKMSGSEKHGNTYDISSIKRVTKKFLEVSRCSQKKCAARAKLFLLIRPIVVFHRFFDVACLPRLALHDFIFCLNKL